MENKYVKVKIGNRALMEHRIIMEKHLGRKLRKFEHVHHINGIKNDNRIENLVVLENHVHQMLHQKESKFKSPRTVKGKTGELLCTRREQLGLSQRMVARAIGWSTPQFLSNIERGNVGIPVNKIRLIASALQMKKEEIIDSLVEDFRESLLDNLK